MPTQERQWDVTAQFFVPPMVDQPGQTSQAERRITSLASPSPTKTQERQWDVTAQFFAPPMVA
jgi:hypothetical protein